MKIVVIGGSGLIGKKVVANHPQALYYGIALDDQSLTPGPHPRLGPTRFDDWLGRLVRAT
jgi:nucleoside-diphosphate-sugar epimerase